MKKFKYTQTFATKSIRIAYPEDKSVALALASLEALKGLVPQDLNISDNPDLLFNSFNAAVVNRINLNDDGIQTATALRIYKNFVHKFCDLEHDRSMVVGSIITAGFSEYLTNRLLSEETASQITTPFNICLGSVVWPIVNSSFASHLVESSDETSKEFEAISASWEIGFDEIHIAVGSRDLATAEIITDPKHVESLSKYLRTNGGKGITDHNEQVYRIITGNALPLGIGYTLTPAAAVKGVVVSQPEEEKSLLNKQEKAREVIEVSTKLAEIGEILSQDNNDLAKQLFEKAEKEAVSFDAAVATLKKDEENKNNSSQEENNTVKEYSIMKFKTIEDITDESLQQSNAAAVRNFIGQQIANEIDRASDEYAAKLEAKENELKDKQAEAQRIQAQFEETRQRLEALNAELAQEKEHRAAERAQSAFNSRMSELESEYELGEREREVIAKRIRGLDDQSYAEWLEEFSLFAGAAKKKANPFKKGDPKDQDQDDDEPGNDKSDPTDPNEDKDKSKNKKKNSSKASVEDALDDLENDGVTPPNTPSIEKTLADEFRDAFKLEDFKITKTR